MEHKYPMFLWSANTQLDTACPQDETILDGQELLITDVMFLPQFVGHKEGSDMMGLTPSGGAGESLMLQWGC